MAIAHFNSVRCLVDRYILLAASPNRKDVGVSVGRESSVLFASQARERRKKGCVFIVDVFCVLVDASDVNHT